MTIPPATIPSAKPATPAPSTGLFEAVLVANRGEIACRIISTLRSLGIRSVAVYSDADADARHVRLADDAIRLGPAPARQSYLDIDAVLSAVTASGAQAVHPGYGFLSENEQFARALAEAGVVFIGPGVTALTVMGDKIRAKNHVAGYGVPVVPGIAEPNLQDSDLIAAAEHIGYPLLIKPSAGGGGKGMQVVTNPRELPAALTTARRVAAAAFGDDTLFLERLIDRPRHIEVQILADNHGQVIHLGERECSLQRRHQKVIEEAPSSLLDPDTRARIGSAACDAARSVGYSGAGTVEFLVSDSAPDEFFFMEMNTRLQVEHPVTELVTGLDLVREQVLIAAGRPLTLTQQDIVLTGAAVEARVYAETPATGFLPTTGTVLALQEPTGDGVRVDSALQQGLEVGPHYDPMLAKVIAWAPDRAQALARLDRALAETSVLGLDTNIEYLRLLLADDDVRAGRLDTTLIERKLPALQFRTPDDGMLAAAALAIFAEGRRAQARQTEGYGSSPLAEDRAGQASQGELRQGQASQGQARSGEGRRSSPWHTETGWRLGVTQPVRIMLALPGAGGAGEGAGGGQGEGGGKGAGMVTVELLSPQVRDGAVRAGVRVLRPAGSIPDPVNTATAPPTSEAGSATDESAPATLTLADGGATARLHFHGRTQPFQLVVTGNTVWIGQDGFSCALRRVTREAQLAAALAAVDPAVVAADPEVRSPMPGTVVSVNAPDGSAVEPGQVLLSVEAMKMEHPLTATIAGTVHLSLQPGDLVKAGQIVATITATPPAESTAAATSFAATTEGTTHA
ncbi:MAG: biotin/lipoyl-binding protein [Micrococcaceae bacterium]|nr:biotin/lipoyl-binding protein [Micrococcaceae bacterium]